MALYQENSLRMLDNLIQLAEVHKQFNFAKACLSMFGSFLLLFDPEKVRKLRLLGCFPGRAIEKKTNIR